MKFKINPSLFMLMAMEILPGCAKPENVASQMEPKPFRLADGSLAYEVSDFGVRYGDGLSDSLAVQSAINRVSESGQPTTLVLGGVAEVDRTLVVPPGTSLRFRGNGTGLSQLTQEPGFRWIAPLRTPVQVSVSMSGYSLYRAEGNWLLDGFRKGQSVTLQRPGQADLEFVVYSVNSQTIRMENRVESDYSGTASLTFNDSMFRLINTQPVFFENLSFRGSLTNPPSSFIESSYDSRNPQPGNSDSLTVRDCSFGPEMVRAIYFSFEDREGDNDSYRIENSKFFKFKRTAIEIQNGQSIWGTIDRVIIDGNQELNLFPRAAIISRANLTVLNSSFNRVRTIVELRKKNVLRLINPTAEHIHSLVSTVEQAEMIDIQGGTILLAENTEPTTPSYFVDVASDFFNLETVTIYSKWKLRPKLNFRRNGTVEIRATPYLRKEDFILPTIRTDLSISLNGLDL